MKKLVVSFCLISSIYAFQGCGNSSEAGNKDTVDSAKSINDSTRKTADTSSSNMAQPVDKMTADFAVKAASGGMMEVQLGKIAREKAVSQRVKDFGAMMVQDHSKAGDELKTRAASQNITLPATPGSDEQKMIDKLSDKSGKDFDKAYMDMMLNDHEKDIAEFRKASDKCTNPSIKEFAYQSLPVLEKHLDSAKAITGKKK
jgi:putative membrane protein